ncbi:15595_t:CDS:2 [Racocetra persica]|uniref:15595_t:CDS:1 n=1 Tax=Racocetra persica TaxID=160502 RepID=A0ACA9Q941_9GLOM|nr:15595_t:CDS:2 [Racocetra persica]
MHYWINNIWSKRSEEVKPQTEDDQVFDYKLLNENPTDENDENSEVINGDDIEGEIYEEVEGDNNVWE